MCRRICWRRCARRSLAMRRYVLKLTGADDAAARALLDKLQPKPEQAKSPNTCRRARAGTASMSVIEQGDRLHGADGPFRRAGSASSVRTEDAAPGVLLQARAAEDDPPRI